jgi:transcriptional regulator with XRE-family HTH domain
VKTFGQTIHDRRKEKGLSLEVVARMCGTHKGYISGIEGRKVNPCSAKITERLCKALDLDAERMIALGWIEKSPAKIRGLMERWYKAEFGE